MRERAVVLVPRWGALKRNEQRDILVGELREADRNRVEKVEDGEIEGETFKRLVPVPGVGAERPTVDVYEVHWADLTLPERALGPVHRFMAATGLVIYWFLHPWWIRSLNVSRAMPFGLALSGVLVLGWYLVAAVAFAHFVLELPADATEAAAGEVGAPADEVDGPSDADTGERDTEDGAVTGGADVAFPEQGSLETIAATAGRLLH